MVKIKRTFRLYYLFLKIFDSSSYWVCGNTYFSVRLDVFLWLILYVRFFKVAGPLHSANINNAYKDQRQMVMLDSDQNFFRQTQTVIASSLSPSTIHYVV